MDKPSNPADAPVTRSRFSGANANPCETNAGLVELTLHFSEYPINSFVWIGSRHQQISILSDVAIRLIENVKHDPNRQFLSSNHIDLLNEQRYWSINPTYNILLHT